MGKSRLWWVMVVWCLAALPAAAGKAAPAARVLAQRHHRQADALSRKGRYAAAADEYRQAAALDSRDAQTQNDWGYSLFCLGRLDAAIERYREALRLRPAYAAAHNNLGAAYYRQRRYPEAQREFEEAVRLRPGDVRARTNLAACLYRRGSYLQAAREFLRARAADRTYLERRVNTDRVRAQVGRDLRAHPHNPWLQRAMTYLQRLPKRAGGQKRRPLA